MPNTNSAKKALRQTKKLTAKNSAEKKNLKDLIKKTLKAVDAGKSDEVKELTKKFQKAADKAVKSGWLKKGTANRRKSRLAKKTKTSKK